MYFDKETDFNFLTLKNNAKILSYSSQTKGCLAINTLNDKRKVKLIYNFLIFNFQ
jgi:hypothetical protein